MRRAGLIGMLGVGGVMGVGGPVLAQASNVHPDEKYCWGENIGFLNWRDAGSPADTQGVRMLPASDPSYSILSGFIWAENVGWISVGDGAPDSGPIYSLTSGSDTGVNVAPDGSLSGYAWGENVGWINLDDSNVYVSFVCPADFNADGFATGDDFDEFTAAFEVGDPSADVNGDGFTTGDDFDYYTAHFDAGC